MKELELEHIPESLNWGFPKPTIIIDSQSAPPLVGVEAEQRYYRMYLMGGKNDIALVNYPVDNLYLRYLQTTLGLSLPKIIQIPRITGTTLTKDILENEEILVYLTKLTQSGYKMQFFNLQSDEYQLGLNLSNPTYSKNLEAVVTLGSKTGFREFCIANNIPMPLGTICKSEEEILPAIQKLENTDVIIKANQGTGGQELGSNMTITLSQRSQTHNNQGLLDLLKRKVSQLQPTTFPFIVEQKLSLPEASLHVFIDHQGNIVQPPTVFGIVSHNQSYVGGFFPDNSHLELQSLVNSICQQKIIPGLKNQGLTGYHCFDFLYDPSSLKVYFIEDNTRPGAIDFIAQLVTRVIEANNLSSDYCWYHKQIPLPDLGIQTKVGFSEIHQIIINLLDPRDSNSFVLVSNPDVLPYGYDLHLTGVVHSADASVEKAQDIFQSAVKTIKKHYMG